MSRRRTPAMTRGFNRSDYGNAERLVERHGSELRYVPTMGAWLVWDGTRWRRDETGEVERRAKETVRAIYAEAGRADTAERRQDLAKWAAASESSARIRAMIELAKSEQRDGGGIPVRPNDLDADPWSLTVANGTLDLRTGELRPHDAAGLASKLVPVPYLDTSEAECPRWLSFLDRVMAGNEAMIRFLQKAAGYTLTGVTREQCVFFLHGQGQNGKSTFLEVLRDVCGEYAIAADVATFLDKKHDTGPRNDVAQLAGARFVTSNEIGEGRRLNEALVKQLTGSETISARFLYSEPFQFRPEFKLWISANQKPIVRGTDDGIWRRLRLIPFTVQIPPAERDTQLPDVLRTELPGVLRWVVDGCLAWQSEGLGIPDEVRAATEDYRAESDPVGAFLEERCVAERGATVAMKELYAAYKQWAGDAGEYVLTQTKFGTLLTDRGIPGELRGGKRVAHRIGIRLRHADELPLADSPSSSTTLSPLSEKDRESERVREGISGKYAYGDRNVEDSGNGVPSLSPSHPRVALEELDVSGEEVLEL